MQRHILPLVRRPVIAVLATITTGAILTEAGLSYLGLADPNRMSWGKLIQNGQAFYSGFGTRMIVRVLASEIGGTAVVEYRPTGIAFTAEAPNLEGLNNVLGIDSWRAGSSDPPQKAAT